MSKSFCRSFVLLTAALLVVSGFFVFAGTASADVGLGVTQITAVKTFATADGTFANGWSWIFDVTVPTNETTLNMKFADWVSGLNIIPAANNIRFYSAQSLNASDAGHAITISTANNFSDNMYLMPNSDRDVLLAGRQIQITIEAAVPVGSAGGSYSTSYGIQTNPDTIAPVITLTGANPQIMERGTAYTELGATAIDNLDGVIPVTPDASAVIVNSIGAYTVNYNALDSVGNTATATRTVNVTDTIPPTAIVSYSTTEPTNQDVVATITPSETVAGDLTHTFADNGSFTFEFADLAGNAGSIDATVNNIDKVIPVITIAPYNTAPTNQDLVVGASTNEGTLNFDSYTFTVNGNFDFVATDTAGNITTQTVTITNIDKTAPTAEVSYSTIEPTNQDVVATITPSETVTITNNGGSDGYTFEENGSFTFEFIDAAGNTGSAVAIVNNIDRAAPVITIAPYNTDLTNQDITVTASTNEGSLNFGSHIFTENGSFDFVATDAAGNVTTQTITITNIDKTAPSIVSYTLNGFAQNVFFNPESALDVSIIITASEPVNWVSSKIYKVDNPSVYKTRTPSPDGSSIGTMTWDGTPTPTGSPSVDGVYAIKVHIRDMAGNDVDDIILSTQTITVDTTKPAIASHADVIQNVATHVGANVDYVLPTVTDADSTVVVVCTPISGLLFAYGDTTITCSATDSAGNQAIQTTFKVSVIDNVFPTLTVNGFTENGSPMPGTIADGFTLNTDNNSATNYLIQFTSGSTASEDLITEDVGLFLQPTGTQTADLQAYYSTKPAPYLAYLNAAAAGTEPFAYIKAGGTGIQILDGAQKFLAGVETDMIVPGNYPLGTYIVKGEIEDLSGNETDVTYKLIVADKNPPVITLNGSGNTGDPTYVIVGESYAELGATATDDRDPITVTPSGTVDTATISTYTITYTATDLSLNTTIKTRTVMVISADQKITVSDSAGGSINAIAPTFTNPIYEFISNAGYYIVDVKVDGVSVKDQAGFVWITGNTVADYTFTNVTAPHTLSAVFELIPTLQSITITTPAAKLFYNVIEDLDITGLVVTGTYSDTTTKTETVLATDVTGFNSSAPVAGQLLTITVNGKSDTYQVDIIVDPGADINNDGNVGAFDYIILKRNFGKFDSDCTLAGEGPYCDGADINRNGNVDRIDLTILLASFGPIQATSPATVNLGTAGDFAILSYAGITDDLTSAISGNIGAYPISGTGIGVTCAEVTGTIYSSDAAGPLPCRVTAATFLGTAMGDLTTAYNDALSRATTVLNTGNGAGEIGGQTLVPGVYTFTGASENVLISTALTLSGGANDVWIFQIPGTFDVHANVELSGGAQAQNIFWVVAGATTLFPSSIVNGNILDHTSIAMQNLSTLNGRALAQTESVTLIANTVTNP